MELPSGFFRVVEGDVINVNLIESVSRSQFALTEIAFANSMVITRESVEEVSAKITAALIALRDFNLSLE